MRIVGGRDVEYTEKDLYYRKNITVKNCFFDGGEALSPYHSDNITFIGNKTSAENLLSEIDNLDNREERTEKR